MELGLMKWSPVKRRGWCGPIINIWFDMRLNVCEASTEKIWLNQRLMVWTASKILLTWVWVYCHSQAKVPLLSKSSDLSVEDDDACLFLLLHLTYMFKSNLPLFSVSVHHTVTSHLTQVALMFPMFPLWAWNVQENRRTETLLLSIIHVLTYKHFTVTMSLCFIAAHTLTALTSNQRQATGKTHKHTHIHAHINRGAMTMMIEVKRWHRIMEMAQRLRWKNRDGEKRLEGERLAHRQTQKHTVQ